METTSVNREETSVGELAARLAGASRVFLRHGLDFCCGGKVSLREACGVKGLEPQALLAEIDAEAREEPDFESWCERSADELIDHIIQRYHGPLRVELPRLIGMAVKVERVHGAKPSCPKGLAQALSTLADDMEAHMRLEEDRLFESLRSVDFRDESIEALRADHDEAGATLEKLREITGNYESPPEACGTWRALYLGLKELQSELMQHVHLENNVLFVQKHGN